MATGYNPFDREAPAFNHESNIAVPYIVSNGQKQTTDPDFDRMTSQDWATLIEIGIVVDKDGTNGGYYLWGNPDTGDSTRSQSINGRNVEFTLAPNAGALINTALLNINDPIFAEIAWATKQYDIARNTIVEQHTWHPEAVNEYNDTQEHRYRASLNEVEHRQSVTDPRQDTSKNSAYRTLITKEQERLRNPVRRFVYFLQNIAVSHFMRLSTAAQISTVHNPAGRVGVGNLLKGINDQIRKPENRRHLEDLGVMNTEMAESVMLNAQSVSQENLGFNQKLLGGSKYWRWYGHGGFLKGIREFYHRGNYTPFSWAERHMIRATAAISGSHYARNALKTILIHKNSITPAEFEQALYGLREFEPTVEAALDEVLALEEPKGGWTEELIDDLTTNQSESAIELAYPTTPEYSKMTKLVNLVTQVMPDYAHYQGSSMFQSKILRENLFLQVMLLFQKVMAAQTLVMARMLKFGYNTFMMPLNVAKADAAKDGIDLDAIEKAGILSREAIRKLPHLFGVLTLMAGAGLSATVLTNLVRFRKPNDDDMTIQAWMMNSAVLGIATGFFENYEHHRGITRQFAGPLVGLIEDYIKSPLKTFGFYVFRPFPIDPRSAIPIDAPIFGLEGGFNRDTPHDLERTQSEGAGFRASEGTSLNRGVRGR